MSNIAIEFMFTYGSLQVFGYKKEQSFHFASEKFRRKITAIKLTRRKNKPDSRTYFFNDGTSCTYQDNYFLLKS